MADDSAADVEELRAFLVAAKRPHVQAYIRQQIESLEKQSQDTATAKSVDNVDSASEKPAEPSPSAPQGVVVERASVQDKGLIVQPLKITKSLDPYYITLSSFGWDQDGDKVNVYISLEGASKDKITMDVKAESFELKLHDVGGKNYRCGVAKLHKPIIPEKATLNVKAKRIVLILRKVQNTSWSDIQYKEDKFKKPQTNDKDPMSGIMDLMKNMYEEGDEEMKRTIAKAWSESRSGKKPDPLL